MIADALKRIKSLGSRLESSVTPEDIKIKEQELGFALPEALRELYLAFCPDDPVFTGQMRLIPLEALEVCRRTLSSKERIFLLPFCCDETYGYGLEAGVFPKDEKSTRLMPSDDPAVWELRIAPKTGRQKNYLNSREVPCHPSLLSSWLVQWLAYEQVKARPSLVSVSRDKAPDFDRQIRAWFPHDLCQEFFSQKPKPKQNFLVKYADPPSHVLYARIPFSSTGYFAAETDRELEQFIEQTGFPFRWVRRQDGRPVCHAAFPKPKARKLFSIAPVLEFLHDFAGLEKPGAKEESVIRAELRLGVSLPLPLKEFYRCLPASFYRSYNTLRPLSSLRKSKDGKLCFLTENQSVYHWAAEPDSPFVYRKSPSGIDGWTPCGLLDGFLAAEFLWALACDETLGLVLWELPDFKPEMLHEKGTLRQILSPVADSASNLFTGSSRTLYQAMNGKAVGLYDRESSSFWFVIRDEASMELLEKEMGRS